ncbi:unnamed protein product [Chrysoparadoxa australica]
MKYLAIDLGSYSVKTMLIKLERKQIELLDIGEFVLDELKEELDPEGTTRSLHRILVQNIVPEDFEGKTIFQLPNHLITSRHLNLPITQRKKVEMMIPFQLDENLPFSTMDSQFFSQQLRKGDSTSILVNVTKRPELSDFFHNYEMYDCLPTVLTSELSVIHAQALNKNINGPIAILDIGHTSSKCYLIYENEVVSHHFSSCAGSTIDEVISHTYQIPLKEAVLYKHQNCFLLTDGQYEGVTTEQKEFALLMKKTITPLVLDLKRWLLGFRVKYGIPIENIYLTGGSTNIHNIGNFFAQQTGVKTDFLSMGESLIDSEELLSGSEGKFFMSGLMGLNLVGKNKPGNFLTGDYSTGSNLSLPLHSVGFYFSRAGIMALVLSLLLGVDAILQQSRADKVDKLLKTLVKRKELGLNPAEQRGYKNRLDKMETKLLKENKKIEDEVSTLLSATKKTGIPSLEKIFDLFSAKSGIELSEFTATSKETSGTIKVKNNQELKNIQEILQSSGFGNLKTKIVGNSLNFSFATE